MYTVKFLDNESFDNLPYKGVATAVGVADRNSNIAYVRDTGNPMDIFTAHHELEHLKGDDLGEHESPDEDGIYYKKLGQFILPALAAASFLIPGVGPAIGGALGSVGGAAGGALSSVGLGGITSALSPIGTALSGAGASFAGAGKAVQGALGFGGGAAGAAGGGAPATSQVYPGVSGLSQAGHSAISGMTSGLAPATSGAGAASAMGGGDMIGGLAKAGIQNFGQSALSSFGKKPQVAQQQGTMDQFNPQASLQQPQTQQDPAISNIGKGQGLGAAGQIRSDMDLAQSWMRQRGDYVGRSGF